MKHFGKINVAVMLAFVLVSLVAVFSPGLASAHGRRTLAGGKYEVVVGFLNEPVFAGNQNGLDLTVCQGKCDTNADGTLKTPVKDADKTLKAEVIHGSQNMPVTLSPRFRADGKYNGVFFPTKAGEYTFHLTGTINGDAIDERFVSGKDGFNSVEEVAPLQFPKDQDSNPAALAQQVKDANDKAFQGTIFGIAGLVLGLAGLATALFALTRRPKAVVSTGSAGQPETVSSNRRGPQGG